jgi:hypothetical protein
LRHPEPCGVRPLGGTRVRTSGGSRAQATGVESASRMLRPNLPMIRFPRGVAPGRTAAAPYRVDCTQLLQHAQVVYLSASSGASVCGWAISPTGPAVNVWHIQVHPFGYRFMRTQTSPYPFSYTCAPQKIHGALCMLTAVSPTSQSAHEHSRSHPAGICRVSPSGCTP